MFRPYNQAQAFLLPPSMKDFLDESHPAHVINDIVDLLDLTQLEKRYGNMGQPAYHPRLMLKVILYGFTVGVFSSRKLQRACEENLAFKYLAGMETPAFKTFIEFRRRHREDMKAVFVQTVKLAREMGLASLGAVALDGCKMDADTSKHKAMSYGRMLEEEKRLKAEIESLLKKADETDASEDDEHGPGGDGYRLTDELSRRQQRLAKIAAAKAALEERESQANPGKPIDPKKQISFADQDARCHAKPGRGTRYVYNAQAAADMESQVIVENHVEDSVQDSHGAKHALAAMKQDLGLLPEKLVTDAGYGNVVTADACREHEVTAVCATTREGKDNQTCGSLAEVSYDPEQDKLTCPHGQVFEFVRQKSKNRSYRSVGMVGCECSQSARKDGHGIINVWPGYFARKELQRIMDEPGNRELYRRRKCTIEPVFGQIQIGMGFTRFFYRGKTKVGSEWNLVCAAFNVKKMAAMMRMPAVWAKILARTRESAHLLRNSLAAAALFLRLEPNTA